MNLFNTLIAQPGETVLSFVKRMSWRNGFLSVDDFYSMCVSPYGRSLYSGYGKTFTGDPSSVNEELYVFSENLPEGHLLHDDPKTFYFEHSLYPLYSMFFETEEQKDEHINSICYGKSSGNVLAVTRASRSDRAICFCKECYDQDTKKYGEPLIHREHQIKGVCVCPIHNTPLWYSCNKTEEISFKDMKIVENYQYVVPSLAYQYALMCKELLESPISSNAMVIEETISNTMNALPEILWSSRTRKENNNYDIFKNARITDQRLFLLQAAQDSGLVDGVSGYHRKAFTRGGDDCPHSYLNINYGNIVNIGLVLLFILYRTADFVRSMITKKGRLSAADKARIAVNLLTDEYSVECIEAETYNTNMTLKHQRCGELTRITARKFMNGERCRFCEGKNTFNEVLVQETDWIVQTRGDKFAIRGNRIVDISEKEVLQEINRPFLSPIIGLTKEERKQAHAKYRAKAIIHEDNNEIETSLENAEVSNVFTKLRGMYPNEEYLTVKELSYHYGMRLSALRFSII